MSLSQLWPNARHLFATAQLSWLTGNKRCVILAQGFTPTFAEQNYSDLPAQYIIQTSPVITNLAEANGFCTGDTINFGVITSALKANSLAFYLDTGNPSTSTLIAYVDQPDIYGMPQSLQGFNYYLYKNLALGGWFRL